MNTLARNGFTVSRQTSGDVWIVHGRYGQMKLIISNEDAEKLAKFILWPPVSKQSECDNKVDYSRCAGEPE